MTTTLDIQRRLLSLGYTLPKFGADGRGRSRDLH